MSASLRRFAGFTAVLIFALLTTVALAAGAGAAPVAVTDPADNAIVTSAPTRVSVEITPAPATAPTARVVDSANKTQASGALTIAGNGRYLLDVPTLNPGFYTVAWQAGSAQQGVFAFDVDPAAAPATVTQTATKPSLKPFTTTLIAWIPWITIMTFVGALVLRLLVTAPAARRAADPDDALARTDRRLIGLAALAILVFVPATITQLAFAAGDGTVDYGKILDLLGSGADGTVWIARLVFTAVAVACVWTLTLTRARKHIALITGVGLAAGVLELAAREVPTEWPADVPRTVFNFFMYLGHMLGASVWVGGLIGMVVLAVGNAVPARARREFWPTAIKRFSVSAMTCVGVLTLSGLWLYWVHIGSFGQMAHTLYGRTLLVKLGIFAAVIALGAVHQFWVIPRLAQLRAAGDDRSALKLLTQHFRPLVALEAVLVLGILLIVPMLSGSGRNQALQAAAADLTRTGHAGAAEVRFTPSGLLPGITDYDIRVDDPAVQHVDVTFASTALGLGNRTVRATLVGEGEYRVSGIYTPVVGTWQAAVSLDGTAQTATFPLKITAKAPKAAKSAAPKVTDRTWVLGIGEVLLVIGGLLTSYRLSRRAVERRSRPSAPVEQVREPENVH